MNAQNKRFLHGVLLEGPRVGPAQGTGDFPGEAGSLRSFDAYEWPFGAHKGARTRVVKTGYLPGSPPRTGLVLTASHGGGLTGVEVSVGLELVLPDLDMDHVYNKAHRLIGSSAPRRPRRRRGTPCRWTSPSTCPRASRASAS